MRLKYYLRGLGVGMVVTALLMGFAKGNKIMTDEEIKARALQLGMVEQKTLADVRETAGNTETVEEKMPDRPIADSKTEETEETGEDARKDDIEAAFDNYESDEVSETTTSEENNETDAVTDATESMDDSYKKEEAPPDSQAKEPGDDIQGEIVMLQVVKGDSSKSVSKKLEGLGLIENASEFNGFLIEKELTQRIIIGEYEIVMGSDMEEIANIITK